MISRFALALVMSGAALPVAATFGQEVAVAAPPQAAAAQGPVEVNGIAAKVNGRVITKNEVSFMLAPEYARLVAQFPRRGPQFDADFKEAKDRVIQELIDRQIIMDEFKQMGASIKPHLIDEEIKRQVRELYNGDEAKFREELKNSRLTMDGYREMTREKMVVQAMRAQQFKESEPPLPNEVQAEYNEVKASIRDTTKDALSFQKIFIPSLNPVDPLSTPETQLTLAEKVVKELQEGKDFGELAKLHSSDAYAEQGGHQENVPRADLSAEFAAIVFDAPEGKIIGPLQDPQGYTIVRTTKKMLGPSPPLSKVREQIEERVRRKKSSVQYERWIGTRRKRAMIDIRF